MRSLEMNFVASGSKRRISGSGSDRSLPRNSSSLSKMANLASSMILSVPEQQKKRLVVTVLSSFEDIFNISKSPHVLVNANT